MKIGLITCRDLSRYFPSRKNPLLTHDDQVAADALAARGHVVEPIVWGIDPRRLVRGGFDLMVIRSPWDYMASRAASERFIGWLGEVDRAGIRLENRLAVVRWNLDKHYLAQLGAAGVPVVPTRYVAGAEKVDLVQELRRLGALVVKPCVSAAAKDTFRLRTQREVAALCDGTTPGGPPPFDRLRAGRDFMIQPFLPEVVSEGEWSLVFLDGVYSHAVHKRPQPGHWLVQDELGGSVLSGTPPGAVQDAAVQAFDCVRSVCATAENEGPEPPLYGRVDVIPAEQGPLVTELELVEPELFFLRRSKAALSPLREAIETFCVAVERRGAQVKRNWPRSSRSQR